MRRLILLPLVAALMLVGCEQRKICVVEGFAYSPPSNPERSEINYSSQGYTSSRAVPDYDQDTNNNIPLGGEYAVQSIRVHTMVGGGSEISMGKILFTDGSTYRGDLRNGKIHGEGICYHPEKGILYEGIWCEGEPRPCE